MTTRTASRSIESGWIKPSTILFATESPTHERAFAYALASAREYSAKLILFHAFDTLAVAASDTSGIRYYNPEAAMKNEEKHLQPLLDRARGAGVSAELAVRPGLAAPQILVYAREHAVDRIVMATRAPGRLGKLFIGSVAEEVLRSAPVPVVTIGPEMIDPQIHSGARSNPLRHILCAISLHSPAMLVAELATRIAADHGAELTLLHVMPTREEARLDPGYSATTLEARMRSLLSPPAQRQLRIESISTTGDTAEEIVYQSNLRQSDLLVFGAHEASTLSTLVRQGVINRVLGQALCPVMTLADSIAMRSDEKEIVANNEAYLAGIF
uniref:UspA domain-containing protein n=1 Tax=mine drainage metagenome TaxID=410659 RepID=E6QN35_9ZZZZ